MKHKANSALIVKAFSLTVLLLALLMIPGIAQETGKKASDKVSILVTAAPTGERSRAIIDKLEPTDFAVLENKKAQTITDVRNVSGTQMNIAIIIQDDLVGRVSNELPEIRDFLKALPAGSMVMTGYVTGGTLRVRQEFTSDLEKAAGSFRILLSSDSAAGPNPYDGLSDALKQFESFKGGRNMVLFISDGLDASSGVRFGSPYSSLSLDRAIAAAQREQVAVFTMYAPSVTYTSFSRLAVNYGQGSLLRLADETGGTAFFSGMDFVSFSPYFREFNGLIGRQWLITYQSTAIGKGFRRIEVTTDFDINLLHAKGYMVN